MNIEEAKAKITELTEEIQRLRKRDGVIFVRAEEKAGDEGLREFIVRIVERAKYLGHSRVDLPVRILEKSLEMYPSRPVSEQKAPAGLVEELESLVSEDNAYYMHINGQKRTGISYVCRQSLQEILSRYRPVADRTAELVKRLREFIKDNDRNVRTSCEYEEGQENGWKHCLARISEILANFEKGDK